jgi:hypothetical protein
MAVASHEARCFLLEILSWPAVFGVGMDTPAIIACEFGFEVGLVYCRLRKCCTAFCILHVELKTNHNFVPSFILLALCIQPGTSRDYAQKVQHLPSHRRTTFFSCRRPSKLSVG